MRNSYYLYVLILILLLSLMACDISSKPNATSEQTYLEFTPINPTQIATSSGEVLTPVNTPMSQENNQILITTQTISCEGDFCQIEWPGWMARPFTTPDRDWIDLTYPYASIGDGSLAIHHGVEFPNPYGTPVHAAADGEVVFAGNDEGQIFGPYSNFYGNVVILKHASILNGEDLFSLYGHLSTISVDEGELIRKGDILGEVGASGVADGSHLHFEVRYGVNDYHHSTNPVLWFSPQANQGSRQTSTLAGFLSDTSGTPISGASITLERLSDGGVVEKHYYFKTYVQNGVNAHPILKENFAIPDLPPGDYRLTYVSGTLYEVYFTLEQGVLGFVNLEIN